MRRGPVAGVLLVVVACLSGCAHAQADRYGGREPAAAFPDSACPLALNRTADVTGPDEPADVLVGTDPRPSAVVICNYRGPFGSTPSRTRELESHLNLGEAAAVALAAAAARVSVARPPQGTTSCPADFGTTTVITFTYSRTSPASLWWSTSGCQTIDDRHLRASLLANPSFERFQTVFARITRSRRS